MLKENDRIRLSASDLMRFMSCAHASFLDHERLHGRGPEPAADSEDGERSSFGARDDFETFFLRLQRLDTNNRLYRIVWSAFPGPIRLFLENRYVFAPFWSFHHGNPEAEDWEARFDAARRRFHKVLSDGDTVTILSMLFDRLYVLRNQLMHGGATWNSATNRDQLRDGAAILRNVVPVMADLMMDAPEGDWGAPMYPVLDGKTWPNNRKKASRNTG